MTKARLDPLAGLPRSVVVTLTEAVSAVNRAVRALGFRDVRGAAENCDKASALFHQVRDMLRERADEHQHG